MKVTKEDFDRAREVLMAMHGNAEVRKITNKDGWEMEVRTSWGIDWYLDEIPPTPRVHTHPDASMFPADMAEQITSREAQIRQQLQDWLDGKGDFPMPETQAPKEDVKTYHSGGRITMGQMIAKRMDPNSKFSGPDLLAQIAMDKFRNLFWLMRLRIIDTYVSMDNDGDRVHINFDTQDLNEKPNPDYVRE